MGKRGEEDQGRQSQTPVQFFYLHPLQVTLHSSAGPLLHAATPSMAPRQVTLHYSAGALLPAATTSSKIPPAGRRHGAITEEACGRTSKSRAAGGVSTSDAGTCTTPLHACNPGQRVWPPQVMGVHAQRPCTHARYNKTTHSVHSFTTVCKLAKQAAITHPSDCPISHRHQSPSPVTVISHRPTPAYLHSRPALTSDIILSRI